MRYLAVLGRQPEISVAELEALGFSVEEVTRREDAVLAKVEGGEKMLDIARLGGTIKLAKKLEKRPLEYLGALTEGKITFGISDYSRGATGKAVMKEELKLKRILMRHGRSVRIVENKNVILSSATSLHNGMSGKNPRKVEFLKLENEWYVVVGCKILMLIVGGIRRGRRGMPRWGCCRRNWRRF